MSNELRWEQPRGHSLAPLGPGGPCGVSSGGPGHAQDSAFCLDEGSATTAGSWPGSAAAASRGDARCPNAALILWVTLVVFYALRRRMNGRFYAKKALLRYQKALMNIQNQITRYPTSLRAWTEIYSATSSRHR